MHKNTELSVIVPAYNKTELTKVCLTSVLRNSTGSYEVIVIDNASTDNTPEVLQNFKEQFESTGIPFTIITNKENVGFGRAMNQGARIAQGDFLALLSNDTWVMKDWDTRLIDELKNTPYSIICPYLYEKEFSDEIDEIAERFVRKNKKRLSKNEWTSPLMFFKKEAFIKVGMFDEDYYVTYEDTDLQARCDKIGLKYATTGNCLIWHKSKGTRLEEKPVGQGHDHEEEGLKIFIRKWGYDPRVKENSFWQKLIRSFRKRRREFGYL